jgi:hypothetical protein
MIFFGLYDSKDKYNFSINIEAISKWFNMTKGHIKETLVNSYIKNIDYKIIKGISIGNKGKPRETILLTPKCFKLMAMQSKTKKAFQVREYYYELEQVIDQYKEYIGGGESPTFTTSNSEEESKIKFYFLLRHYKRTRK